MRVLSAASVLVTLVYCTADDVPRWSKPDDIRSQGEWVPLKSDRINQQPIRIPSAITSPRHNHERSFPHHNPANQFIGDYPKQQMVASQTAPQRIAFVNPQGLNQQQILQSQLQPQLQLQQQLPTQLQPQLQQQLDSQQLLTQFLNQQIQQASLPIFNRALLQKEPVPSPHYYSQGNQFGIVPNYNQGQLLPNEQYTVGNEREIETDERGISKDAVRPGIPDNSYEKLQKPKYSGEPFNSNLSSVGDPNQKEEIQILYVPIEMLKQQEQNLRNKAAARKPEFNQPLSKDLYSPELGGRNPDVSEINNQKESRKFRHPIQPLKDQVPAYHLKQPTAQGKAVYSNSEVTDEQIKDTKQIVSNRDYKDYSTNYKPHQQSRGEYVQRYETENSNLATSVAGNKEQNVDETTIKDEISDYKHAQQDRNAQKEYVNKPEPSLPPPNQPPLSVFMEKTTSNRIGDLINLLRGSKTIPVLDSIGPDSPQVFVGPSNLNTPSGYIKYELPYLSSLDKYQTGNKLSQVPFFVAPLNFQPPPGFAKIPFPPPHIGSVVLSNISQQTPPIHQNPSPQSNPDLRATNYNKETFTIPADISSISPQLPSLINSLQEEEYSSSSSTETLTETTEATPIKQRRPSSSRKFNSRGSQRGSVSYASTTKRPSVSRQRRPLNRNTNHRTNPYSEVATNVPETPTEHHYEPDPNYYQYKSSKDSTDSSEKDTLSHKVSDTPQFNPDERHQAAAQYSRNVENAKEDDSSRESFNPGHADSNPGYISKYSNDDTVATTPEQTLNGAYYSPDTINKNIAHSSSPQYQNVATSGETYDEYQPTNFNGKTTRNNLSPTDKRSGIETTRKYEEPVLYQQGSPLTYPEVSSITNDYEEVNYRKRQRDNISVQPSTEEQNYNYRQKDQRIESPQSIGEQNYNYRQKDQRIESPQSIGEQNYNYRQKDQRIESPHVMQDADYSQETLNKDTINLQSHARKPEQQRQTIEDGRNFNPSYGGYVSSNEEQNTTPFIQKSSYESASQESLEPYRDVQSQDKLSEPTVPKKHSYHDSQSTTNKNEDYNERTHYDSNISETPKPTTERTFPTRSRSRGRGRPYHQYKVTSTEPPINSSEESDEQSHYTRSDVTTSSPGRRYSHTRAHRRPLRPTASTTTTTTTNAPPGTKYLIRTRRPTVPQTKLHNGRGRIRRPTTPTTTLPTTTTEHLQTLPVLWQQPHRLSPSQNDYRTKDSTKQTHTSVLDSAEYAEETPQYSDERVHDKSTYEPQNDRNQDLNQGNYKKYPESGAPRRVPTYSYETQEENFPTQKQFRATPQPYYTDDYETTPRVHYARNYETTQKQHQYRDYETTQKPQYSKDYETTQKAYYPRDYETTQRTQYSRPYDTTQKVHNSRDYATTEKAQYLREYETTDKPQYSRDYETTPKQQYYREYETTQKPQYYREYETTQNPSHYRSQDSNPSPKYFNEYDTTKKVAYDYETTEKPKSFKDSNYYETTKRTVNYKDYETTPRPYVSEADTNEKQSYVPRTSHRTSNHRRRPSTATTKHESPKPVKNTRVEEPAKDTDSDYWNQGVTIQQSQSYVFNPDETYSEERQVASPKDSKHESSQNDYDDYYNTQEGEQYSSDQSPYPSNEQKITYTQIKEGDYTGKASQYPRKDPGYLVEDGQEQTERFKLKNDSTKTDYFSSRVNQETPIMEYEADHSLSNESEDTQQNSKITQGNRKRGTWVRRKIKKPKDLFETAESQRISSVRENSLVTEINPKELQINNYTKERFNAIQKESNLKLNETTKALLVENAQNGTDRKNTETPEQKKSEVEQKNTSEEIDVLSKEMTEMTTEKDEAFNTYQTTSITTLPLDTIEAKDTSEPYRTSTTTEISLETEICYKGQCIKTKRRKEDRGSISSPSLES
ncbi:mucin-2 [Halyomorpha halys]|uniref:mucin-2 n=1 Tax=Halyomorpha halys TaxID=286706 RepID=UPI0006D4DE68|nr:uncharacterized protein LOC106685009 [Halyomorpha halys]